MVSRKHRSSVDLVSTKTHLEQTKTLVVSLGLPYSKVRTLDDAIRVVDQLITKETTK